MIRKGTEQDIPHIAAIYEHIHDNEESGRSTVGWIRGVYPTADTARAALKFYEDYARENGCLYLRMDTNARNQTARKMYAGLGYWEAGIMPCVFNGIPGVQLVCLEKKL